MILRIILGLFLLVLLIPIGSATPNMTIEWQKCFGGSELDYAASNIIQTSDGGYFVAGKTSSHDGDVSGNHGMEDFWVIKLNPAGDLQWQKCLGGSRDDEAHAAIQTTDGGFLVSGYTESNNGNVSGNHGDQDVWVVRLNQTGDLQWQKCLGGTGSDISHGAIQTSDGGFLIAGETASNDGNVSGNHGSLDFWIIKLNAEGGIQWQKCLGGSGVDGSFSISSIQTRDGGYLVAGESASHDGDVSGNHGGTDLWVVKITSTGSIEWQKCLGGTRNDGAWSAGLLEAADGGYVIAGETASTDGDVSGNHGNRDSWVVRLNQTGNIEWERCLGGPDEELTSSISQTSDGGYLVSGGTSSDSGHVSGNHGNTDFWLVKILPSGAPEWQKCFGGSKNDGAYAASGLEVTDGGFIMAGETLSKDGDVSGNHGNGDFWVVKAGYP